MHLIVLFNQSGVSVYMQIDSLLMYLFDYKYKIIKNNVGSVKENICVRVKLGAGKWRKIMKIIVVHPGKQHSYRLAESLEKEGHLLNYITSVYNKDKSWTNLIGSFLKGDDKNRFLTRKNMYFDEKVIQFCEIRGLLLLLLYRIQPKSKLTIHLEKNIHKTVYKKTIQYAKGTSADAIVFYGGLQKEHFELKDKLCSNIKVIIDVPIATGEYMKKILENDIQITRDEYTKIEQANTWSKASSNDNIPIRNLLADGFLAGSSFVKKSLTTYGADQSKIKIVPYGVDTSKFTKKQYNNRVDKVTFIFVGRVDRRKGIQHLLPAFKRLDTQKTELILVGQYDKNDSLIKKYIELPNIKFKGFVTQDVVVDLYKGADVFVLPSLGEGLAQVGIEAMSCGLPIIVSKNAGVNDLIENGKEGFIVPVSNSDLLYEQMKWFVDNINEIKSMGINASETAGKYTWEYYGLNVCNAIKEILDIDNEN